jgi:hypothetical protein
MRTTTRCAALLCVGFITACDDAPPAPDAALVDAPSLDAALVDAPALDVPSPDVPVVDAPSPDATLVDAPSPDVVRDGPPVDVNPLGLTPGVAVTRPIGPIARPSDFDLRVASRDLDYGIDLAAQTYTVRLPARFDPTDPSRRYGIVTYIDAGDAHVFPASYAASLDARDILWIGAQGVGNAQPFPRRMGAALLGALRMIELYPVDPARVYVSGLSGGSRAASVLGYLRQDVFRGFIGRVGAYMPAAIPGWQTAGTAAADLDANYELIGTAASPAVALPVHFRTALMTQYGDFRRAENTAIYRYGHLNHGNTVRLITRPGGHADEIAPSFEDALAFMYAPAVDVVWDRFEDADLGANGDPGRTAAGTGFVTRRGAAREERYAYNGASLGVLRLAGDGAEVEARETFAWRDAAGITLDARLRAESAAGRNQRIGMHIVPAGTAPADAEPGVHVYWGYGEPSRIELVGADRARRTLATWTFAGPHPMAMATSVMSPQAGEGTVPEKAFWNAAAAPDAAGATLRFRGEDVRLALGSVGFQLTFNRPASGLTTPYAGSVVLQSTADGEELPVVLQGFWSSVETATIAALPAGRWRVVFTNASVTTGSPAGDALLDEVHLVGSGGAPAAPPALRARVTPGGVALTWAEVSGAASYRVLRAASAAAPFAMVGSAPGYASTYTDATVTAGSVYAWRVAAVGDDGVAGAPSPVATATP